ncbi:uncharacterized protein K452DRAFT_7692 [Aplosporella prunicola CBS 121167]|uniref:Uncharacterized protein n=1 Tax=Aplosporella prunicola CBS 121167 TaxID=1176127 RepID=A0A6A6BUF8_9PEZI|nr:uncharacterized protein K452DRAFT_7692 [Aplosporella prunicola CBS 121167]KAF2147448.1 hypothetical protein K452DRAFT_7692 [Aplosporella prunicola CBS 121167]
MGWFDCRDESSRRVDDRLPTHDSSWFGILLMPTHSHAHAHTLALLLTLTHHHHHHHHQHPLAHLPTHTHAHTRNCATAKKKKKKTHAPTPLPAFPSAAASKQQAAAASLPARSRLAAVAGDAASGTRGCRLEVGGCGLEAGAESGPLVVGARVT